MIYAIKVLIAAAIIVAATEVAKKSQLLAAIMVALPLTSMMTMVFLYYNTRDMEKVTGLAKAIPMAVIPSFIFFFAFIILAKIGMSFTLNFLLSATIMLLIYAAFIFIQKQF